MRQWIDFYRHHFVITSLFCRFVVTTIPPSTSIITRLLFLLRSHCSFIFSSFIPKPHAFSVLYSACPIHFHFKSLQRAFHFLFLSLFLALDLIFDWTCLLLERKFNPRKSNCLAENRATFNAHRCNKTEKKKLKKYRFFLPMETWNSLRFK